MSMTTEEKENMTLSIENAMLKGFEKFAETVNNNIIKGIDSHKQNCALMVRANNSFSDTIKDWKTIAASIIGIAWVVSTTITVLSGKPPTKFTSEQVKQIAQQVQEVTNPIPVTDTLKR